MDLITVIVPIYNSAQYIADCVESVLRQTYIDFELLLIDDGSWDDSREICERMCKKDKRVRLICQEHKGVSSARNMGIENAKGKYLFFLDSDDVIHMLLLEELVNQLQVQNADLAVCGFQRVDTRQMNHIIDKMSEHDSRPQWKMIKESMSEKWFHIYLPREMDYVGGLFRRDAIGEIRFDENLFYGEDTMFKYCLMKQQMRVAVTSENWYYYRMHTNNTTRSKEVTEGETLCQFCRIMRDEGYKRNIILLAINWENRLTVNMEKTFLKQKKSKNEEGYKKMEKQAIAEINHPLFQEVKISRKVLFYTCFFCYPIYIVLRKTADFLYCIYRIINPTDKI